MKILVTLFLNMVVCILGNAQNQIYFTSSGEIIVSSIQQLQNSTSYDEKVRLSAFFNFQENVHHDLGSKFGFFHGLAIKNIGFTTKSSTSDSVFKYRTYNLGIPIGIKIGKMKKNFLYTGYSFELPINFKHKIFVNEKKVEKFNTWFSRRNPTFAHGLFLGFHFKSGIDIKIQYYLNNFFNKNYQGFINGVPTNPYRDIENHVFYFALSYSSKTLEKKATKRNIRMAKNNSYTY